MIDLGLAKKYIREGKTAITQGITYPIKKGKTSPEQLVMPLSIPTSGSSSREETTLSPSAMS